MPTMMLSTAVPQKTTAPAACAAASASRRPGAQGVARGVAPSRAALQRSAFVGDRTANHSGLGKGAKARAGAACARRAARPLRVVATTTEEDRNGTVPLPSGPEETVRQCSAAINRAISDGKTLLDVEFLLPLIGATDLDDWPGGVRQQFKAACPMVESILRKIPGVVENGGCRTEILDQADAIGLWEGKGIATVLFPTAETVDTMIDLAKKEPKRPLMTVNTQWTSTGQIVSDFGWGPWKAKRENFLAEFTTAYFLKQYRILGENVRMIHAYPGKWQVIAIAEGTQAQEVVAELDERPSYQELEAMMKGREGSIAAMDPITRLSMELKFNADSLQQKPPQR